jgi:bifunctional non-homologous end joining protein LigD
MIELPMMAIPSTGSSGRHPIRLEDVVSRGWVLDLKLDGVRSFNRYGRLINREGTDITHRYPELEIPTDLWLDGEIVAADGTFETTLIRDQQSTPAKIKRLALQHPCKFVAFDLLDRAEDGRPYASRRLDLEQVATTTGVAITPTGDDVAFFDKVAELGMEGVIAKRPSSRYHFGRRSRDWVKFKVLHRVSAVAIGYVPGQGQRKHFGSMRLAFIGPDGPMIGPEPDGWRVGSGFTDKDTWDLKRRLDDGELMVVEVECTARTKDNGLRFPVYKGIRSDVPLTQCTIDQVEALPTY